MKKILPIIMIITMISSGCSFLTDPSKDIGLVEDIIDDVVEMETGHELNLGPEHKN